MTQSYMDALQHHIFYEMDELREDIDEIFGKYTNEIHRIWWEPKNVVYWYFRDKKIDEGRRHIEYILNAYEYFIKNRSDEYVVMVGVLLSGVYFDNMTEGFGDHIMHEDPVIRTDLAMAQIVFENYKFKDLLNAYTDQCCQKFR